MCRVLENPTYNTVDSHKIIKVEMIDAAYSTTNTTSGLQAGIIISEEIQNEDNKEYIYDSIGPKKKLQRKYRLLRSSSEYKLDLHNHGLTRRDKTNPKNFGDLNLIESPKRLQDKVCKREETLFYEYGVVHKEKTPQEQLGCEVVYNF